MAVVARGTDRIDMGADIIGTDAESHVAAERFTIEPQPSRSSTSVAPEVMQRPRFVSANIHRSLDGRHVVNYAQWRSQEDFTAMRENPAVGAHMARAACLAQFTPIICEVVHTRQGF